MKWREQIMVKILLLVARIFADDPIIAQEIRNISNHIGVNAPKVES